MYMNIGPDAERLCSARALARGNRSAEIIISYNYHTHTSFVTETILWRK